MTKYSVNLYICICTVLFDCRQRFICKAYIQVYGRCFVVVTFFGGGAGVAYARHRYFFLVNNFLKNKNLPA